MPKQALIYEGDQVRLWVAHDDKSIELRLIKTGLTNGNLVEVKGNLKPGRADRHQGQPVHRPRGVRELGHFRLARYHERVMAGLVPAIHVLTLRKTWMPGTSPGMTSF